MIINVTQEDIDSGTNPIVVAVRREHNIDCFLDEHWIVIHGKRRRTLKLPESAENFNRWHFMGGEPAGLKPFSFEVK